MWVAKDKNGKIHLSLGKPNRILSKDSWVMQDNISGYMMVPKKYWKQYACENLKWEDEPLEVEILSKADIDKINRKTHTYTTPFGYKVEEYVNTELYKPIIQPENFYLNKETYTDRYYNIIRRAAFANNIIIHWELDNKIIELYIDCIATLDKYWFNEIKNNYVGSKR